MCFKVCYVFVYFAKTEQKMHGKYNFKKMLCNCKSFFAVLGTYIQGLLCLNKRKTWFPYSCKNQVSCLFYLKMTGLSVTVRKNSFQKKFEIT